MLKRQLTAAMVSMTILVLTCFPAGAFTIGNELIDRDYLDSYLGIIMVMADNPFEQNARIDQWSFFTDVSRAYYIGNTRYTDRYLTPLLLAPTSPDSFSITGIGETVAIPIFSYGSLTQDFNLVSGSSQVRPGYFFGWWYGDLTTSAISPGSVVYSTLTSGGGAMYSQSFTTITLNQSFTTQTKYTTNGQLNREYSYSVSAQVPEPSALILLGCGMAGLALIHRRREARRA